MAAIVKCMLTSTPPANHQHRTMQAGLMQSMSSLLDPKAIAVVGASQRRARGTRVIANLRDCRLQGRHLRGQSALPGRARLQVLRLASPTCRRRSTASWSRSPPRRPAMCWKQAYAHGIPAAVVLSAGFGEGGHGRSARGAAAGACGEGHGDLRPELLRHHQRQAPAPRRSAAVPKAMRPGPVALVSQSGSLGQFRVQSAGARPQARLQPFHLVRQPDRHHGRGLCRTFWSTIPTSP